MGQNGTRGLGRSRSILATIASTLLSFSTSLAAEPADADGVYGRFNGDIGIEPGLGVEYSRGNLLPQIDIGASYVSTVGLRLRHANSKLLFEAVDHNRSVTSFDFEVRPLFLARWSEALEAGPALLDLTLDSFMLGLGVFWDYDRNTQRLQRGTELMTGFGVPLLAYTSGPWIRATAAVRLAEGPNLAVTTHSVFALTLGWNLMIDSALHEGTL
jgi:hypothetical protein